MSTEPPAEPVYPFVAIDVPASLADVAADQLFELGAQGVEQRDGSTLSRGARSEGPVIDPGADVGAPVWTDATPTASDDEVVTLVAAFADRESALTALAAIDAELSPRLEEVVGDAWRDAWKAHFEPFRLSPHLVVRPPWREASRALIDEVAATHVLELEPGRAFGTGLHESTALVAAVLDARQGTLGDVDVLDVGCGSGILALAALTLGARRARAIDVDPDAVRVARDNAARAGFADRLDADDTDVGAIEATYPWVLANIQAEVLVPRAADLTARLAPSGVLVLSGILTRQADAVRAAYPTLTLLEAPTRGEWTALVLQKAEN
ncbi:MAG: 50S ribosomal protein L11 methyltransferase [Polyangiales bacterium]